MRRAALLFISVFFTATALSAQDTAQIRHLLSRATFGVRDGDINHVQQVGTDKWLDEQLHPERIDDSLTNERISQIDTSRVPDKQRTLIALLSSKLIRATVSDRQLEEVMTDFWFNHFNVFWGKGPVRYLVSDYENTAIRPYVFGKFYDMLHATASHPAMLLYLDNAQSNVRKGINENYAREVMELHTLGVDGGYTQQDVTNLAHVFTGWTVQRKDGTATFRFAPFLHDREDVVVRGKKFHGDDGMKEGEDALRMLSRDPHTAHFIAKKLVQRFVSDDAPEDFVNDIAKVFLKTDGDLRAVTKALFTSPKFYDARYRGNKVKMPLELVASAVRLTGQAPPNPRMMVQTLRSLGELPYMEQAPTGYPVKKDDWVNSGAMMTRMNFGIAMARGNADLARTLGSPAFQLK